MKDPRFDTQDDFIERYDGYREVGHINDGTDEQNPDTVSYDIYIEHEYTKEEMDAVSLRQVESIAMENSPNALSAEAFWFGDSERLFNDKAELYIGIQSLNEQVDRRPMVKAVQKYMDACVLGTESGMEKFCREYAEKYKSVMPAVKERLQYLDEIAAGNGLKFSMTDEAGAKPQFMLETVESDFVDVIANIPVNDNMEREV